MKPVIFIDGQEGTTGLRIADRLAARQDIEILTHLEAERKDVHERANASTPAMLLLPLPAGRGGPGGGAPDCESQRPGAGRLHRPPHRPGWVYGLPELGTTTGASCPPPPAWRCRAAMSTGFIAPVAPLVEKGLLPKNLHLNCYSLTGYSGGGKKMIADIPPGERGPERPASLRAGAAPQAPAGNESHHGVGCAPNFVPIVADFYSRYGNHDPPGSGSPGPDGTTGGRYPGRLLRRGQHDLGTPLVRGDRRLFGRPTLLAGPTSWKFSA